MKITLSCGLAALVALSSVCGAQPRPMERDGRPPMGGQRGGPRATKMRLPRLIMGASRLSGSDALTKKQARQMLRLVSPWQKRATMDENSARALFTSLAGVLTPAQKTALENDHPGRGGGPDGGGPRRGGGPGGGGPRGQFGGGPRGGGPGGQRPDRAQMDALRGAMESFNPLYSGTTSALQGLRAPFAEAMQRRRDRLNGALSQLKQLAR